ncbi:MAG: hypothetical protein HKN76_16770 [Saprospiraceae bacterium]|nr:hypothetical protein [Saprospiraceae bacterium]
MNPVRTLLYSLLFFCTFLYPSQVFLQSTVSLFDLVYELDSAEVTIETDFKSLLKKKDEYQEAKVLIKSGDEVLLDTVGEIRTRGNARKTICYMPPTKLRFDKKYLENRDLSTYPTLKVVNSCSFTNLAESYVRLEHLIYEAYNILTDRSFRTKFIKLKYIDSQGKKNPVDFEGFLIEHEDQMADRMHGEIFSPTYFKPEMLHRESYILFAMFQYMIGNTDWKVLNKHNLEIVKVNQDRTCYPVAYDFDYAGAVHATYAVPNEKVPIKTVTERFYLGPCQTDVEIESMRALFSSKKDEIMALVEKCLSNKKQQDICAYYLGEFYEVIENEKMAQAVFSNCIDY